MKFQDPLAWAEEMEKLRSENAALKAELAEAKKDAERYRWLRSKVNHSVPMVRIQIMNRGQYLLRETSQELDAAIDEAMKGK